MEITKCQFAFFTIAITFMYTETAGFRAGRFRQELSYIREDISALFEKTDQLNISVVESCGPCVFGNKNCSPVTKQNGRQEMVQMNNNKVLLKYRSLIKAFGSEKKINRNLQFQLRSMENNFSAIEKVVNTKDRKQQSLLQSMEASISAANERYREHQRRLRSVEDSISDSKKVFNEKNQEVKERLQSMEASISDKEKVFNEKNQEVQSQLQSMEASNSDKEKVFNEKNQEVQSQLQSMEASISDKEKVFNEKNQEVQGQLQSIEASISAIEEVANERYRELQSRLRSLDESIEDKISNMYRDLRNDISFMTTVSKSETTSVKSDVTASPIINTNCKTVPESGVYTLHLELNMSPVNVYCDQETDGGGWIVFMRRQDGSVNFYRPWLDYKQGFGSPDGEFWAGNELLYKLTKEKPMQLRIDMEDFDGNTAFAMYEEFQIGTETDKYRLYVSGYSGTSGDSLIDTRSSYRHVGMQFSTFDSDNDESLNNCAYAVSSGWWYNECFYADLNAPYSQDKTVTRYKGIIWNSWKEWESLKRVEMKIR